MSFNNDMIQVCKKLKINTVFFVEKIKTNPCTEYNLTLICHIGILERHLRSLSFQSSERLVIKDLIKMVQNVLKKYGQPQMTIATCHFSPKQGCWVNNDLK